MPFPAQGRASPWAGGFAALALHVLQAVGGRRGWQGLTAPRLLSLQQGVIHTPPVISSQQGHCKQPAGLAGALCHAAAGLC